MKWEDPNVWTYGDGKYKRERKRNTKRPFTPDTWLDFSTFACVCHYSRNTDTRRHTKCTSLDVFESLSTSHHTQPIVLVWDVGGGCEEWQSTNVWKITKNDRNDVDRFSCGGGGKEMDVNQCFILHLITSRYYLTIVSVCLVSLLG